MLTGVLLLRTQDRTLVLNIPLQVIFLLFHVLNRLVALAQEALKPSYLAKEIVADLGSTFCGKLSVRDVKETARMHQRRWFGEQHSSPAETVTQRVPLSFDRDVGWEIR